jgi:hypothetical protein
LKLAGNRDVELETTKKREKIDRNRTAAVVAVLVAVVVKLIWTNEIC